MDSKQKKEIYTLCELGEFSRDEIATRYGITRQRVNQIYFHEKKANENIDVKSGKDLLTDEEINKILKEENELIEKVEQLKKPENVEKFVEKCKIMADLYELKNKKYGNSFSKTYKEYGNTVLCIRLEDKLSRIKQILLNGQTGSVDESVIDSLIDLANYSIMAVMELENE